MPTFIAFLGLSFGVYALMLMLTGAPLLFPPLTLVSLALVAAVATVWVRYG